MLPAVLTILLVLSAIIIFSSIKNAVEVDEKFQPVKRAAKKTMSGKTRSMTFPDYSKSSSIA